MDTNETYPQISKDPVVTTGAGAKDRVKLGFVDFLMIFLAVFSVMILLIEYIIPLDPLHRNIIIYADLVIVAIFFTEFMFRISKSKSKVDYVIDHWYDIIGMIPAAHPLLRGFRLFRIFRVLVIASRLLRSANRIYTENILKRFLGQYKVLIVDEFYDILTVRVLELVEEITDKTDFSRPVRNVIRRRQDDIKEMVTETMDNYAQSEWITKNTLYKRFQSQMSDLATRVVIDILEDEKTNEIIVDIIKEVLIDIKADISGQIQEESKEQPQLVSEA